MLSTLRAPLTQALIFNSGIEAQFSTILSPEAREFLAVLGYRFATARDELLVARAERQKRFDTGELPNFLPGTARIRAAEWTVSPPPADLCDRRVEITGPVDRKMVINALNSGAKVFMADFEDAHSPTWEATLEGQVNLYDAVRGQIQYTDPRGKEYRLNAETATLVVRPRGWHLDEKHAELEGGPLPASLFDFGLYFFHNARALLDKGSGPYFYLPKMQSHREARLWADVFDFAEHYFDLPRGTIRATVLIETLPAAFEMDEILHELRDYAVGLNCGRWDYIFSFIKCFHKQPEFVLPDRDQVGMTRHFLRSYSKLLIQTCHRRGAHAMGGMAAQIPIRDDEAANADAFAKVRADKEREAGDGHDGTWVAHPGLVPVAMEVFDRVMPGADQKTKSWADLRITAVDLLKVPAGSITETGLRNNVSAALRYLEAWLGGRGAVPIHHLMEDAATAEIARSQLWQWIRHPKGVLEDGRRITQEMVEQAVRDELDDIRGEIGAGPFRAGHYAAAADLLCNIVRDDEFAEFLTLKAYDYLP
ncbi:MAG: malate synthase A [Chromatiales bacterium]|nr:malate synthase A [Chromatiales bacterium]